MNKTNPLKSMISKSAEHNDSWIEDLDSRFLQSGREIIDNAFDAIFVHTIDGKLLEANHVACKRLGYSRDELVNKEREELISLALIGSMPEYIELIKKDGELTFESVSITDTGELIPVEVRARRINYQGDDAILTFSRNLTDQKRKENEQTNRLKALHRHAVELSRLYSIENVAEYTFEVIKELLGQVFGAFGVVEEDYIKFIYTFGKESASLSPLHLDDDVLIRSCVRIGKVQNISDVRLNPHHYELFTEKCVSEFDIPVKVDGKVVAVIVVQSETVSAFSDDDRKIVEILSEHVSSSISRIELLHTRLRYEQQILSLHQHAASLNQAKNVEEVIEITLDTVEAVVGCRLISYLRTTEKGLLAVGNRGSLTLGIPLPLNGKGITTKAAREQRSVLVNDTRLSPDFYRGSSDSLSEIAIPVILAGSTIGVINLEDTSVNSFSETDLKIVETLALHVSSVLERLAKNST